MNKQQYLKNVSILSDPTNAFWREYDEIQLATIAMRCAKYKYKKTAQVFAILAGLCSMFFIVMTWVVQQNTMGTGLELFIIFASIFTCACVMFEPAKELLYRGQVWDKMENNLKQAYWDRRNK